MCNFVNCHTPWFSTEVAPTVNERLPCKIRIQGNSQGIECDMSSPPSTLQFWAGRILTGLPALMLIFSAAMKLKGGPDLATGMEHLGWPLSLAIPLGILELSITVIYLIPRTAVLGAILLTGYLGGAVAAHLRINEPWFVQFLLGVMLWGGLYFRDSRIRQLIPVRPN